MTEFSPDGRRLVLASGSSSPPLIGQATLLDSVTGEMLLPPLRHGGNGRYVRFSPDGTLIASVSDDGTARLWDAGTGEPVSPVLRHDAGSLATVVFSPDGRRLVTFGNASPSSANATMWEVPSGRRLATFPDTASAVIGEFSPDGQHFMSGAPPARRILLWGMAGDQPVPGDPGRPTPRRRSSRTRRSLWQRRVPSNSVASTARRSVHRWPSQGRGSLSRGTGRRSCSPPKLESSPS